MIPDLSDADRGELRSFMARLDPASGALGWHEAQGFLFALACSPELVPPSEWIPWVLGTDYGDHLEDLAAAQRILPALMALYNEVTRGVVEGPAALPPDCPLRADPMANFEADAPVAGWSRGFATGWIWLEESWEELLTDEVWDILSPLLAVLFTFASREKAQLFLDDPGVKAETVEVLAGDVTELLPDAVRRLARISRAVQEAILEEESGQDADEYAGEALGFRGFGASRPARAPDVPGRNAPCPCGSGRKYKKCCGREAH